MMRDILFHGVIFVVCLLNFTSVADAKGKNDLDGGKFTGKAFHEEARLDTKYYNRGKNGQKPLDKPQSNRGNKQENTSKKFIGRIEHGKVKVLRRPDESVSFTSTNKEDTCKTSKSKKHCNIKMDDSEEEQDYFNKKQKKNQIKYSIKFRHEKQKTRRNGDDASIMRLHKNGRKYDKEDNDSSEEDDEPIKRLPFLDDED